MKNIGCESIPYISMHKMLILCIFTYSLIFPLGTISTILYCVYLIAYPGSFFPLYSISRKSYKPPDISFALLQARAKRYPFKVQKRQALALVSNNSTQFTLITPVQDKVAWKKIYSLTTKRKKLCLGYKARFFQCHLA